MRTNRHPKLTRQEQHSNPLLSVFNNNTQYMYVTLVKNQQYIPTGEKLCGAPRGEGGGGGGKVSKGQKASFSLKSYSYEDVNGVATVQL